MKAFVCQAIICLFIFCVSSPGQPGEVKPPAKIRSHVERFSTPQMQAEKQEAEATAKISVDSSNPELFNDRALARMRLDKFNESAADLRQAIKLKPNTADYFANLGYVLWKLGKSEDAVEAENQALKIDENNFQANYQLARFLLRLGDDKRTPEAIARLRKALEIDPRQYDVRFELIAAFRTIGDAANATAQLDLLQDARPSDARVDYVRALLATDRNDFNLAIADFKEALKKDNTLFGAWQDLGLIYVRLQRWQDVVETFTEFEKLRPNSVEAAYFQALALYNLGNPVAAEKEVRRTLRLNDGVVEAKILLGIILAARGSANVEAAEILNQAIALSPTSFDANFYLGRVQYALKDFPNAIKSFQTAIQVNPKHSEARFFLGTVLETAGNSADALKEYEELIKLDPNSTFGQLGLGAVLVKQGKLDEAIVALQKASTLDAQNFEAFWALGRALALKENFIAAVDVFEKAVELAPERAEAHYQLGLAYRRVGKTAEATREFEIVNRLNRDFRTNTPTKP